MVANGRSCRPTAPDGFKYVPPDGGFGWWVLCGTCLAGAIAPIPLVSFGFIFGDILTTMNTTASTCSWIPSMCASASLLIAPVANIIITKYSCRVATICGGILSAVGMILSYFATNVVVLFLTFGVIYGAGYGFVLSSTVLVLTQYFRVHYGLATGISFASTAAGKLIFSPLIQLMLEVTDYHGLFLILSALCLNVCVGGALFQPGVWHQKLVANPPESLPVMETDESEVRHTETANGGISNGVVVNGKNSITGNGSARAIERNGSFQSRSSPSSPNGRVTEPAAVWLLRSEVINQAEPEVMLASAGDIFGSVQSVVVSDERDKMASVVTDKSKKVEEAGCYSWWKTGPMKLEVKLLTEPIFYVVLCGIMMGRIVTVYQVLYFPSLVVENGLLPMQAAAGMSIKAGGEIAGRILAPYILERFKIPLLPLFLGLHILQDVILVVITFMTSFAGVVVVNVMSGLASGGYTGLLMLIYVDSVGLDRLPSIFALTKFLQGLLVIGVGPVIGLVKDLVGAFNVCFYILALVEFCCVLAWSLQPLAKRKSFLN